MSGGGQQRGNSRTCRRLERTFHLLLGYVLPPTGTVLMLKHIQCLIFYILIGEGVLTLFMKTSLNKISC